MPKRAWFKKWYGVSFFTLLLYGSVVAEFIPSVAGIAQEPSMETQSEKIITGILEKIELKEKRGQIKTALGEPVFFSIRSAKQLNNLSEGQHVTAKLDLRGQLITIIETPAPELQHPQP